MKFNQKTLDIINAVNLINSGSSVSGIVFKKGQTIKARRFKAKTPILIAQIDDFIEKDFAVYDLKKFISCFSMLEDPEILLNDDFIIFKSGRKKIKLRYANPDLIEDKRFFDQNIKMPETFFSFPLSKRDFKDIKSASARLGSPELLLSNDMEGKIILSTYNSKDKTSDKFELIVGENERNFNIVLSNECLNFLEVDYQVTLTTKGLVEFKSENLAYYITMLDKSEINI